MNLTYNITLDKVYNYSGTMCEINAHNIISQVCTIYYDAVYKSYNFIVMLIIFETLFIYLSRKIPYNPFKELKIKSSGVFCGMFKELKEDYNLFKSLARICQIAYFMRIAHVWYLINYVYPI